jgi:uncharacterized protein YyaL (SSP411 family)
LDIRTKLINWFLDSSIFDGQAYLEYYSPTKNGPRYPEITGYAISLCSILYDRKNDGRFLDRAETCVKYMMKINKGGGVPCLRDNILYTFDTGVYVSGLFDLYSFTEKEIYLKEARKSLKWLLSLWHARQFAAVDKFPEKKDWYHVPSVHLLKLVIPLMKASKYLQDEKHMETALKLLNKYIQVQNEEGSFRINGSSNVILTHPHCYATEGLLYAYYASKRQEFLEAAEKSSQWLCKTQNSDGSFYLYCNTGMVADTRYEQKKIKATDSTAQATRIWKLLGANRGGIEKAYAYLNSQLIDDGLRLYRVPSMRASTCSWPTFFYLHSLLLPFGETRYCREIF